MASSVITWIVGLFPDWEPPGWLINADDMVQQVFGFFDGLSPWVDWAFIGTICLIPFGVWAAVLLFKGVRVIVSHVPFFGGRG